MKSVPIATKFASSNTAYGEVYSIQHYVKKFDSDLISDPVFSTNKTDRHDISELLLNGALNTLTLTLTFDPSAGGLSSAL